MMSLVFSNNKSSNKSINTVAYSSSLKSIKPVSSETSYSIQYGMIGRLLNTKKCDSCPIH